MVFIYDPKDVEEISLYRHTTTYAEIFPELICSFHSLHEYADSPWGPDHEDKDLIDSLEYSINGKIWQSAKSDMEVSL